MVSNAVSRSFARQVEGHGVTVAEWVFLRTLLDAGETSPTRLAARMAMTKGAISKLAERLIDKGLVARMGDGDDRRAQILSLTAAGKALVPRLAALADDNDAAFFGALAASERKQLETLLRKIARERDLTDIPVD